jgi:4-hydroxyphenylpyruvate dioxygenase
LAEHEMSAPVASFQGGLLDSQGEARQQHWQHFAARLGLCRQLSIPTLVVAADVAGPLSQQDLDRVTASLSQAAQQAAQHDVRLALEFQSTAAFCNNLQTAAAVVAETASPHLGICLDAFHFFTGPSKTEDLGLLSVENLFHVQLCDLVGRPRELAGDVDRILPGDGDLPLELLLARLRDIDYAGCVSVELMNPQLFQVPARQFGEIAITALRKLL